MYSQPRWQHCRVGCPQNPRSEGVVIAKATTTKKSSSKSTKSSKPTKSSSKPTKSSPKPTSKPEPISSATVQTLPQLFSSALARVNSGSHWGVKVTTLDGSRTLFELNSGETFIPASNRKVFTAAFALDQLGSDFQYRTYLYRTGSIDSAGGLKGSLVIRPQGDPTFSDRLVRGAPVDWIYRDWVTKVQSDGIKSVEGDLIIDCSDWNLDDLQPRGWPARIKEDYYAPKTSPLTINENLIEFRVNPGKSGEPGEIQFIPEAEGYPVVNRTVTGGKGAVSVSRDKDGKLVVTGAPSSKSAKSTYAAPCDNPTLYAAAVFRNQLKKAGITVRGPIRVSVQKRAVPAPTAENVIAVYISPPMGEVVKTMMKHSNNHFAEQIFVSVPAVKLGSGGYRSAKTMEDAFLKRAGINPGGMAHEDGSGLSEMNRVSPSDMCKVLSFMGTHKEGQVFFDSLPIGGLDGTLRGRMHNENSANKVHAKTGYINRVSCLSGYVALDPQRILAFSFLVNDVRIGVDQVKGTQDRLCEILSVLQL